MAIHSSGQAIFSLAYIEGITLGAAEEVDEVAGGAGGMGLDRIGEGDRASKGQVAGVYGAGFTVGSLARVGTRDVGKGSASSFLLSIHWYFLFPCVYFINLDRKSVV